MDGGFESAQRYVEEFILKVLKRSPCFMTARLICRKLCKGI